MLWGVGVTSSGTCDDEVTKEDIETELLVRLNVE